MCERFSSFESLKKLADIYWAKIPQAWRWEPSYNIAATHIVPVVLEEDGERILAPMRWGLVPFWAKDVKIGNRMINAEAETIATKPGFRECFSAQRCIVPANGFYAWLKLSTVKRPFYFTPARGLFSFAGLWSHWDSPEGRRLETFSIVTMPANEIVKPVHNRMPVILAEKDIGVWLSPETQKKDFSALTAPATVKLAQGYEVGRYVNSAKNTGPDCIAKKLN